MRIAGLAALMLGLSSAASALDPASADDIAASFNSLCVVPFGDAAKVAAAAEAAGMKTPEPKAGLVVSNAWQSEVADLGYSDAAWLPRDLPSPQCSLSVRAKDGSDHLALVAAVQSRLGIAAPTTKGKNGRFQSEWNLAPVGKDKRRLFVTSTPSAGGVSIRLSLLNLRG